MKPKYEPYVLSDVKRESAKNKFTVISTFAGGGGSSTGYRLAGGNVLLINEFVEEAIATYRSNFPETKVLVDDIKKYKGEDFLSMSNLQPGELDIFDGSPPCSAFSMAGKREKGWNQTKIYSDGKVQDKIEDLFLEFIRVANVIKPKVIVAENVQGITVGEAIKKLNEFINKFEDIGYHTSYEVLSSADFGVAQNRRRTIFVCVRHDVADAIGLSVLNINSILPKKTTEHCSMESAIGDLINDPIEEQMLFDYVQKSFQKEIVERMPFRPKKPLSYGDEPFRQWNPKGSYFNMIRPSADMPCPTITQRGQQRPVSGVLHYEKNRKLTIAELKRIMGLPDDYILTGTFDQQAERICRMVPPKLICAVATSIYENVLIPYRETL